MAFADITSRQAIIDAIQEFDRVGRKQFLEKYGFGESREYFLIHQDREYDSKAIVGAAHGYQFPHLHALGPYDFHGGHATVEKLLKQLEFSVRVNRHEHSGETPPKI